MPRVGGSHTRGGRGAAPDRNPRSPPRAPRRASPASRAALGETPPRASAQFIASPGPPFSAACQGGGGVLLGKLRTCLRGFAGDGAVAAVDDDRLAVGDVLGRR